MKTLFITLFFAACMCFMAQPVHAQEVRADSTTVSSHDPMQADAAAQQDKERTAALQAEYKAKAKEDRRIERDAANALKQMAKAERMEKKAQRMREKADKQHKKAKKAVKKSDKN